MRRILISLILMALGFAAGRYGSGLLGDRPIVTFRTGNGEVCVERKIGEGK